MTLTNPALFFGSVREGILGPTLDPGEVDGCNAILAAMEGAPLSHAAYAFGTAFLETGSTMHPVREANWLSAAAAARYFTRMYDVTGARPGLARKMGNTAPGDGAKYCGRGYPQMTWKLNYTNASKRLIALGFAVDLVAHPERAMEPAVAAAIMRHGMTEGWFTGKKLGDYLRPGGPGVRVQFIKARAIINGSDRASDVADAALQFQSALIAGGWA